MKIDIRNNSCKAVLWDLDGTIVDSASYHRLAWNDVFRGHGIDFTDDIYKFTLGRRNNEIIRRYIDPAVSQKEVDIIAEQKEESFRKHIKGNIRPFPFVVEMIKSLAAAEFQLAIVSSATMENISLITEELHINTFFNLFITGKDVTKGKPNPQGFLAAADRLGVPPKIVSSSKMQPQASAPRKAEECIALPLLIPAEYKIW